MAHHDGALETNAPIGSSELSENGGVNIQSAQIGKLHLVKGARRKRLPPFRPTKTGENLDVIMKEVGLSVSALFQPIFRTFPRSDKGIFWHIMMEPWNECPYWQERTQ